MLSRLSLYTLSLIFLSLFYFKSTNAFGWLSGKVAKVGLNTAVSMNPDTGAVMPSSIASNLIPQRFHPPISPMLMNHHQQQPVTQQLMMPESMGMPDLSINNPQMAPILSTDAQSQLSTVPMMAQQQLYNPQVSMPSQYIRTPAQQISIQAVPPSYTMRAIQQPLTAQISSQPSVYVQSGHKGSYNQQHIFIPNS